MEANTCPIVILCGGKGTRLREETEYKPKPMVEIGGKPILWHVMRNFAAHGFRDFVVCLGYRGELIREYFLHYRAMGRDFTTVLGSEDAAAFHDGSDELDGCRVALVDTGQETGTGGRVARAEPHLTDERFIVSYGDATSDLDVRALYSFHRSHGRIGTLTAVRAISRFGVLELDGDSVATFREKPQLDDWVSGGYFVFERAFLDRLDVDSGMFELEPLQSLVRADELNAFRHEGFWQPMDTYREYELLNDLWRTGSAPWLPKATAAAHRAG